MTHQTIRISLMLWERLLKSLNAALLTALLCVALYALVTNFSEARGAIGKLFVKFTQIESFEGFNVKAAFRVDQIAEATPIYQALPTNRHLSADGLITMKDSREVKAQVLEDMRQAKARNRGWPIGEPRSCYVTELTERGRNVKTALAQFLRAGFAAATGTPAARRDSKMKVAEMAQ